MKNVVLSLGACLVFAACQSAPVSSIQSTPHDERQPTNVSESAAIGCWRNAKGMSSKLATEMCLSETAADGYQCWKQAKGLDDHSALLLCKYARPESRGDVVNCWKAARGVDSPSASVLCLADVSAEALNCWRNAKGVDSQSAALLCLSPNAQTDIECWRGARGVDNLAAAQLCFTGSRASGAYSAWVYMKQKNEVESAYTSGQSAGYLAGKAACR